MKVAAYLYAVPPYRYTGGELMTLDLLRYLASRGHTVHVFVETLDCMGDRDGLLIYPYRDIPLVTTGYDIVVTHPELRIRAIKFFPYTPYVGIVHNTQPPTLKSLQRRTPDLTVANSNDTLAHFPSAVLANSVVINPPVTITPVDAGQGAIPPVSLPDRSYITMVNISHEKGGGVLAYVAARNPDLTFLGVIGGHGEQMTEQPDNVTIVSPTDDMRQVYDKTRILMFPTKRESYGKVAAEAMQWGIPCIVSDIPALHEVCEDSAVYVDPHDYAGWNTAVRTMADSDLCPYAALSATQGRKLRQQTVDSLAEWERRVQAVTGR